MLNMELESVPALMNIIIRIESRQQKYVLLARLKARVWEGREERKEGGKETNVRVHQSTNEKNIKSNH